MENAIRNSLRPAAAAPLPQPAAPPAVAPPPVDVGRVARVRALLLDEAAAPHEVRTALASLDLADLQECGFPLFEAAFLSAFGDSWPRAQVRTVASDATRRAMWGGWEWRSYMAGIRRHADADMRVERRDAAGAPHPPRLTGWNVERLRGLLGRGRGLLVCSFHYGAYRFLISDLALLGFDAVVALDAQGADEFRRVCGGIPAFDRVRCVNVEAAGAVRELRRTLDANGVVLMYVDGNTGTGGRAPGAEGTAIEFLNSTVRVKAGAGRLAAVAGTPIVPVTAPRVSVGVGSVEISHELVPSGRAEEGFADRVVVDLYAALERAIRTEPRDWEGARLFNRWRAPEPVGDDPMSSATARTLVTKHLGEGDAFHARQRWITAGRQRGQWIWTDIRRMRSFALPARADALVEALTAGPGVTAGWIAEHHGELSAEEARELLAVLLARDAVAVDPN